MAENDPAQHWGLQSVDCVAPLAASQAVPPVSAGVVTVYVRDCVPVPHVLVHVLYALHDPMHAWQV